MEQQITPGACLCGSVRFEVTGALDRVAHGHCTICERANGAAFVTWIGVCVIDVVGSQVDAPMSRSPTTRSPIAGGA